MDTKLKKAGNTLFKVYEGVGVAFMGIMAFCVVAAVILRYLFNISFAFLEEFVTLLFTFCTFWGVGICFLKNEHVVIDFFFARLRGRAKKYACLFNYAVVLYVTVVFLYYSIVWVAQVGSPLSIGMRVPMYFLYTVQPLGVALSIPCIIIQMVRVAHAPAEQLDQVLAPDPEEEEAERESA